MERIKPRTLSGFMELLPEKQAKSDQAHLNPEADNANLKSTSPVDTKSPVD